MDWWALSNASSIVRIRSAVHEILADEAFTATDSLISQPFVVAFVHPIYMRIALIWGFPLQFSLWKLVHWLWRYKLNEVCDRPYSRQMAQHISWSQGHSTSPLISKSILQMSTPVWTAPDSIIRLPSLLSLLSNSVC